MSEKVVIRPAAAHNRPDSWQAEMKFAIRDPLQLCRELELPTDILPQVRRAAQDFPVFVPRPFLRRMALGRVDDPLLLQVMPLPEECTTSGTTLGHDPVGDQQASRQPGLIHKYAHRVLLVTTGACAVHCRYCFRRHFPYSSLPRSLAEWESAMAFIEQDSSLDEVILSGGDPFTLQDDRLEELFTRLDAIPHLARLRIHTRLPIMIPQRLTGDLLRVLANLRLRVVMVVHVNHAQEIDQEVADGLRQLQRAGAMTLNQAVLLRGVNDRVDTLQALSLALLDQGVMPYYLHQLDRVTGAEHFEVPESRGLELMAELRCRLPGYAVPRYVREVAGEPHKRVLA